MKLEDLKKKNKYSIEKENIELLEREELEDLLIESMQENENKVGSWWVLVAFIGILVIVFGSMAVFNEIDSYENNEFINYYSLGKGICKEVYEDGYNKIDINKDNIVIECKTNKIFVPVLR